MGPQQALLTAVRDVLREYVPLRNPYCDMQPSHQPPPSSGQYYVSVFPMRWVLGGDSEAQYVLDRRLGVGIGVTQRTGVVPEDRMYEEMSKDNGVIGLVENIDRVMRDCRYLILKDAMAKLSAPWTGQFVESLALDGTSLEVRSCGPDHFRAPPTEKAHRHGQGCNDYGRYAILPYSGCRYMQTLAVVDSVEDGEGVNFWAIENDFTVQPDVVEDWSAFIGSSYVNQRSGDYSAFSNDSRNIAIRKDYTNWEIHNQDGLVRAVDHPTSGASIQDFMWVNQTEYFWINGFTLEHRALDGSLLNSWALPEEIDGRAVSWRSSTGSGGSKQMIIGLYQAPGDIYHNYVQSITTSGLAEGFWVDSIRPETRFHNLFLNDGVGLAGSFSGPDQALRWTMNYDGSNLRQVQETQLSHPSFWNNEVMYFTSVTDGVRHKNLVDNTIIQDITQQELKDAAGITEFAAGGHIHLTALGAVLSVQKFGTTDWYLLYWQRSDQSLRLITGPHYSPRPAGVFFDAILPTISPDNNTIAFHSREVDELSSPVGVRIVPVPD